MSTDPARSDFWFLWHWCCPSGRFWCRLDLVLRCKVKAVCNRHDDHITGGGVELVEVERPGGDA